MMWLASTPAPQSASAAFVLGQNTRGQWVIKEVHGLMEALFINRKDAVRSALYESGFSHPTVITSTRPVEIGAFR